MSTEQSRPAGGDFDADRPIDRRDQDRLGRRSFAEEIAKHVLAVPAEHGFTIAVVGEWGSGKTSLLNMVAESLMTSGRVAVLRFDPWLFSQADDLMRRFFGELGEQLGQREFRALKDVTTAVASLSEAMAPLSPVPGTNLAVRALGRLAKRWTRPRSLREARDQLTRALTDSGSRVVVLLDDIDRLEPTEMREVMRLVRLTSDFPNLVFLLAFDRHRVARALGDTEGQGRQYLEKLVQVSYDVPVASRATLAQMLIDGVNGLITDRKLGDPDRETWTSVLHEVIRPLLSNPRDVKRYLYSLPVTLDVVGKEVALADLLGLEAIRILRPRLFEDLRAHADYLVTVDTEMQWPIAQDERKRRAHEALSAMLGRSESDRPLAESAIRILFPLAQESLSSISYGPEASRSWRRHRRVASGEVFRIYSQGALGEAALETSEIRALVEALTDEDRFAKSLDSLDGRQLEEVLERLADFEEEFPSEAARNAIPVLIGRMGGLGTHAGPLLVSPRDKGRYLVLSLLRGIRDDDAREGVIRDVLSKVETLSGANTLVAMIGHRGSVGRKLVSIDEAAGLEHKLVCRLESATSQQLAREWSLARLLIQTLSWVESKDRVRLSDKLRQHLRDDEFVLTLLRSDVGYAYSGEETRKLLSWNDLEEAFGHELSKAVARLADSRTYEHATDDDRDTVELAKEYASGLRPASCD